MSCGVAVGVGLLSPASVVGPGVPVAPTSVVPVGVIVGSTEEVTLGLGVSVVKEVGVGNRVGVGSAVMPVLVGVVVTASVASGTENTVGDGVVVSAAIVVAADVLVGTAVVVVCPKLPLGHNTNNSSKAAAQRDCDNMPCLTSRDIIPFLVLLRHIRT